MTGVLTENSDAAPADRDVSALLPVKLTMALSGLVLVLMMLLGLVMRLAQGGLIDVEPQLFYEVMTAHGIGMVGAAGISGAAIMWFFLARHVRLTAWVYWTLLGFFLSGVVLILWAIFVGHFAGAWTFLYPLPAKSGGVWEPEAAATYLAGLLLVGVGFLLYYLETGRAILVRYRSLGRALAWPLLFHGSQEDLPPPSVVASAAVTVFNGVGVIVGAAVIVISLINLYLPAFGIECCETHGRNFPTRRIIRRQRCRLRPKRDGNLQLHRDKRSMEDIMIASVCPFVHGALGSQVKLLVGGGGLHDLDREGLIGRSRIQPIHVSPGAIGSIAEAHAPSAGQIVLALEPSRPSSAGGVIVPMSMGMRGAVLP